MHNLPYEMMAHIFVFVEDNIYVSMVCKTFRGILQKMYVSKQLSNVNDPYVLSKIHKEPEFILEDNIPKITNKKSLDYIATFICESYFQGDIQILLLKQNCISNNLSTRQPIHQVIKFMAGHSFHYYKTINEILNIAFKFKRWSFLEILMSFNSIRIKWIVSVHHRYDNENDIDIIIDEMDYLNDNKIMSYGNMYESMDHYYLEFKFAEDMKEYLRAYLEEDII